MSTFVVVTFPAEAKAYQAVSTFNQLHSEGSITLYGTVVVERREDGTLATVQGTPEAAIGTGLGALFGALVGAFGGPVGLAVGTLAGGAAGGLGGLAYGHLSEEFLEDVGRGLEPGMFAVLAEVSESWTAPVNSRMEALGGKVMREERSDVFEDIMERRAEARRDWIAEKKIAHQTRKAERMEERVEDDISIARDKLQRLADKARARLDVTRQELDDKLKTLSDQAAGARPEVKKEMEGRITAIRREFSERERKLSHAVDVAQEALQP
jgi:uncharacterized membrane protein